jgi:hypothetical protein
LEVELRESCPSGCADVCNAVTDLRSQAVVSDDRCDQLTTTFERHEREYDRNVRLKAFMMRTLDDRVAEDGRAALRLDPLECSEAMWAGHARVVRDVLAVGASLYNEHAIVGSLK